MEFLTHSRCNHSGDGRVKTGTFWTVNKEGYQSEFPYVLRWFINIKSFLVFVIHEESFMINHQIAIYEHFYVVNENNRKLILRWLEPQWSIQTVQSCQITITYSRTPLIRVNWDVEPSGYPEYQDNCVFL